MAPVPRPNPSTTYAPEPERAPMSTLTDEEEDWLDAGEVDIRALMRTDTHVSRVRVV